MATVLLAEVARFIPVPGVAAVALFSVGLGNGPVFPNMSHLTPIHFGQEVSQSFMGVELASTYGAFMIMLLLFGLVAETAGVGAFPVACLATFVLTASATLWMTHSTGRRGKHD